jgi:F-type H+-transporting ATPase subunit gamma
MAKTQDIKRRIRSIGNTRQVTKAMKMVSASKLRRSQEAIFKSRPYAERTLSVLRSLAARANPELNPLLQVNEGSRVEMIVITADRGLCGAFNSNLIRLAHAHAGELGDDAEVTITAVGRKGRDWFKRRNYPMEREWIDVFRKVEFSTAEEIGQAVMDLYTTRQVGRVVLVYNEFKSAIAPRPLVRQLLPIKPAEFEAGETAEEYLYEPSPQELFAELLPHYVKALIYQAMLESAAAEHAARMTAMDNATKNAGELIDSLTLTMNRVRQAGITTEIIEVVSGAEALK